MLARAQHRVMVCQGKWGFAAAFERLASTVDGSEITQAGDRYLLLSFDPNTKKFCSRIYVGRSADWDSIAGF
jgi:hypothetical protein